MNKLRELVILLLEGRPLPPRYKDHPLQGRWRQYRDCHIEPDWSLIYKIEGNELHLVRTGSHSDPF
jgi:mRNA interferase YafQ